jgi:hypothetical protein
VHEILDWNVQQLNTMPTPHHSIVFFCDGKILSAVPWKVLEFYILIILAFHLRQKKYNILVYGAVIHSKQGARGIVDKNVQNRDTTILTTIYENC